MTAFVVDLDGVLYRGNEPVPGAGDALLSVAEAGHEIVFCTNNSFRSPESIAEKIRRLTGFAVERRQVVTSAMAAARVLADLGVGRPYVVGGPGIRDALADHGASPAPNGSSADGVVVGLDYGFSYETLHEASMAARAGAPFVATNRDATFPAEGHLRPGAGSMVAAVATAAGREPVTAGKPHRPIIDLIRQAVTSSAVVVVGDRPETDWEMGFEAGWITIGVGTGIADGPSAGRRPPDVFLASLAELPESAERHGWWQGRTEGESKAF